MLGTWNGWLTSARFLTIWSLLVCIKSTAKLHRHKPSIFSSINIRIAPNIIKNYHNCITAIILIPEQLRKNFTCVVRMWMMDESQKFFRPTIHLIFMQVESFRHQFLLFGNLKFSSSSRTYIFVETGKLFTQIFAVFSINMLLTEELCGHTSERK